jgi:hypothetical protein
MYRDMSISFWLEQVEKESRGLDGGASEQESR